MSARRLLASLLALGVIAVGAHASAQEPGRVLRTERIGGDADAPLAWAVAGDGGPVRVVVHGTLTSDLDGAEIDALSVRSGAEVYEGLAPVVLPPGTILVETRGPHEFVLDVPSGGDATLRLNVPALAGRALVTATELRQSLRGAILVDVLAPPAVAAAASGAAPAIEASLALPLALAAPAFALLPLGLLALLVVRRRQTPEERLLARSRRARAAILREARVLGPAFDGALAATEALAQLAVKERAHLAEVDRALGRTAWVGTDDARAGRAVLLERRGAALSRLGAVVARLEEGLVRMAACVADRSAIEGVERDLAHAREELEVGEQVERELATLSAN